MILRQLPVGREEGSPTLDAFEPAPGCERVVRFVEERGPVADAAVEGAGEDEIERVARVKPGTGEIIDFEGAWLFDQNKPKWEMGGGEVQLAGILPTYTIYDQQTAHGRRVGDKREKKINKKRTK